MHQADALPGQLEVQVEGQVAHEPLRALVGVLESPRHRFLADLAVLGRRVEAAAVVEVAGDRVVVVAVDRRCAPLLNHAANLVRPRSIADEIAAAVDILDAEFADPGERSRERWHVAVDVGDDCGSLAHLGYGFSRHPRASSAVAAPKAATATSAVTASDSQREDS